MGETGSHDDALFPAAGGSIEADYLGFLAQQVPKDIVDQLYLDGQPERPMYAVDVADLVLPLSSRAFPTEKLFDMVSLLWDIVIG